MIGSNRTSNEENYLLQKFARVVLGTNNIDHHRTADFPAFASALAGKANATASMRDVFDAPAILLIGNNPTEQHPLLAWQIRTNVRLHRAKLYVVNSYPIKLRRQATAFAQIAPGSEGSLVQFLAGNDAAADAVVTPQLSREALSQMRDALKNEKDLVVIFGSELRGDDVTALVNFGLAQGAKFICLGDYANSRGAADMGLYPDMLPGYAPVVQRDQLPRRLGWTKFPTTPGLNLLQMMDAAKDGKLKALYVVGSNPVARYNVDPFALSKAFVVVQDMFLTETAGIADVVLPVANAYEKGGTYHQHLRRRADAEEGRRVLRACATISSASCASPIAWDTTCTSWCRSAAEARAPTWARRAARNRAKPTVTPCGSPSTISSPR